LLHFLKPDGKGYKPLLNLFGASNYIGAIATVILFLLLALSNDLSLRRLKGRRWKFLQRFNYMLSILALIHAVGYQVVAKREKVMMFLVLALSILVLFMQGLGLYLHGRLSENFIQY